MSVYKEDAPTVDPTEPLALEDQAEVAPRDSEIDFDDEKEDDQEPLDVVEAIEAGVLLDDPENISDGEF